MPIKDCIEKALKAKQITEKQAEKIRKFAASQEEMSEQDIIASFVRETLETRRRTQLQTIATKRNLADIKSHPKGTGRGVESLLIRDTDSKAPFSNVDYRRQNILADLHARLADAMSAYRTKNLGFSQDVGGIKRMVRELFGESSGDVDAARFAGMWRETAEVGRMRHNVAGGTISRRKDWGLPHLHDPRKIVASTFRERHRILGRFASEEFRKRGGSFEEWADFIVPRLDRSRMFNKQGHKMTQKELDQLVNALYDQFALEANVTARDIARSIPNKPDHRLLTFKNSKAWLEYNERFGNPDIYHTMMTHLDHLAGDTALLEILGPNPDAAIRQFTEMAAKSGYPNRSLDGLHGVRVIRDSYEVVTGRVNQAESDFFANFGTTVRNLLSSAQLGSAFVSSFSDLWTTRMTAAVNGMPSVKFLGTMLSQMNPANEADRIFAVKLGLGAEAWITRAYSASRFQEITGQGISARISDTVFRATLLSPWTDAGRKAFGMEFLSFVGDNASRGFKDLPDLLHQGFKRYGITEQHWNIIRRTPLIERDGVKYLRPMDIVDLTREEIKKMGGVFTEMADQVEAEMSLRGSRSGALGRRLETQLGKADKLNLAIEQIEEAANRMQEMVLTEMDFAVPMPDARIRALATQGQRRGSLLGEGVRSVALYKQFPITIIATHLYRGARGLDGLKKGQYLAELMLGMTVMGALAVQVKNIAKGRDPQDMTDPKFWAQAFAQGGGGGIYGDFIQSTESRFGKSFTSTLAGPVFGLADDIVRLTGGNLHQVLSGKEANFMRETIRFAKRYTPGSNAWYARVALERLFWNRLLEASDPRAHKSFRRTMQRARKDFNQEFWWRPGEIAPRRAPAIGR